MIRQLFLVIITSVSLCVLSTGVEGRSLRAAQSNEEIFSGATDDPYTLAVRAFVWGYPLVRSAQIRLKTTQPDEPRAIRPPTIPGGPINTIGHARALSSPETRLGVAPNNDTLYSLAWLDLSLEPFVMETPDFGDRYYTFQMGQADTSTFESFGQRTHGGKLPPIFIYGPNYKGEIPNGMTGVRGYDRYLMIAGRILVNGSVDLSAVHGLQDKVQILPLSTYRSGRVGIVEEKNAVAQKALVDSTNPVDSGLAFLEMLSSVLKDRESRPEDASFLHSLRTIGITKDRGFQQKDLTESQKELIVKGLADGEAIVQAKTYSLGRKVNGWSINYVGPHFGDDYLLRAAVAMDQIYVLEPSEALYPSGRVDSRGEQLDGNNTYRIYFSKKNLPPVNFFWSVTLYFAKGFMVPNPINRWSIGDRTPGLTYKDDGSLEIVIQHERPNDAKVSNWLPAPKEPFMLLMRLYGPKQEILDGTWLPPSIERTNVDGKAMVQ